MCIYWVESLDLQNHFENSFNNRNMFMSVQAMKKTCDIPITRGRAAGKSQY